MPVSRLDIIYRKILLTKFFTKGWGPAENLIKLFLFRRIMSNRDTCYKLVPKDYPITIINESTQSDCRIIDGKFRSPFSDQLPDLVLPEIQDAYFQMVLPTDWGCSDFKPICIHLAGTGDHYFWRRRNIMAKPLIKNGIAAIILENPYYGYRKPKEQLRSSLHYVSDIFVMGGCLILECIALLNWCESLGFGPLGVSGLSMGGHGVMSESIDWDMLQNQFLSNLIYCDTLSKLCKIVDSPFACDLSRIPEYSFDFMFDMSKVNYVTPYEMLRFLNTAIDNCPAIPYRHSTSESRRRIQSEFSTIGILRPSKNVEKMKKLHKEAVWFMRGMMDEFTHLKNFSVPFDTSLIIAVCAKSDGYVPRTGISTLDEIWPGTTVKYIDTGHVGAYLWHRKLFRSCIVEAFERAKKKIVPP